MKRVALIALAGLLALSQSACEGGASRTYLSIGTGGTGGIYYPFGGALASRLSSRFPDRQFTAEVTAASLENLKRLQNEEMDLAMAITLTASEAYQGSSDFPEPFQDLRIVAPMWPNPVNVLVPANSDIRSVADLRGRRVAVGAPGSGTEQVARAVLGAYGLTYDDIEEQFLSFSESSSGIRDGSVAAAILEVAYPAAAIMEATTTGDARLVPLEGPEIEALLSQSPTFYATTIPAGAYRGVNQDVPTIAELNWIFAREEMDPEVVRAVLDILHEEHDQLVRINEIVRQIDLQALRSAPIPLHPATRAWMKEKLPEPGAPPPAGTD